ncbi:hypothetical protein [Rhizobium sp. BK176]|uniref:hypothetical protein n=1 Tax=Rhizobium sp. BK176 TaxID=2587071 RepID=UPI0021681242|nr:hypothetical protein [Rhizobium sp. BK176]MCS4088483.1 hypothetical protein [Rhizobium sp. BK176]
MLAGQELKAHAVAILENLYPEIEIGFYQSGGHDKVALAHVRKSVDDFMKMVLDTEVAVNSEFTKMAELAAELVYLGYHYPDEFAEMFSESSRNWNRDIDIRTVGGFDHLFTFYRSVCDDHDYCLDPRSDKPLVKLMDQIGGPVRSFGPNKLLAALQEYRRCLAADPAPSVSPIP